LTPLFEQFLRERTYLHNITPKTREFYQTAWKAFLRAQAARPARNILMTVNRLISCVMVTELTAS